MKEGVTFISQKKAYSEEIFSVLDETEIDYVNNAMGDTDTELIASDDISYHLAINTNVSVFWYLQQMCIFLPLSLINMPKEKYHKRFGSAKNRTNKKQSMSLFTK